MIKQSLSKENGKSSTKNEFLIHFSSGMLAETIACLVYVPVDVIKERLQVQQISILSRNINSSNQLYYQGSFDAFTKIMRNEGVRGIYKGYGATLASFGPFSALYFVFYEQLKQEAIRRASYKRLHSTFEENDISSSNKLDIPLNQLIFCSASAGALASWLTSPLDMAKLRLQIQRGVNSSKNNNRDNSANPKLRYKGMIDCIRTSYVDGGVQGLFRGAGARVLHFTPATAITMTFYEKCRSFYADQIF